MKKLTKSAFFRALFLLTFIVNMFLIHIVMQDYVFCIENNGNVVLEKINSDDSCCSKQISDTAGDTERYSSKASCNLCNDFTAIEKYGDVKSKNIKHISVISPFIPLAILSDRFVDNKNISCSELSESSYAPPLEAYKTVSLLI